MLIKVSKLKTVETTATTIKLSKYTQTIKREKRRCTFKNLYCVNQVLTILQNLQDQLLGFHCLIRVNLSYNEWKISCYNLGPMYGTDYILFFILL